MILNHHWLYLDLRIVAMLPRASFLSFTRAARDTNNNNKHHIRFNRRSQVSRRPTCFGFCRVFFFMPNVTYRVVPRRFIFSRNSGWPMRSCLRFAKNPWSALPKHEPHPKILIEEDYIVSAYKPCWRKGKKTSMCLCSFANNSKVSAAACKPATTLMWSCCLEGRNVSDGLGVCLGGFAGLGSYIIYLDFGPPKSRIGPGAWSWTVEKQVSKYPLWGLLPLSFRPSFNIPALEFVLIHQFFPSFSYRTTDHKVPQVKLCEKLLLGKPGK